MAQSTPEHPPHPTGEPGSTDRHPPPRPEPGHTPEPGRIPDPLDPNISDEDRKKKE